MFADELKPKNDDCTDGKNCQKVVNEGELPQLLSNGWKVVACLPSGAIVVSND